MGQPGLTKNTRNYIVLISVLYLLKAIHRGFLLKMAKITIQNAYQNDKNPLKLFKMVKKRTELELEKVLNKSLKRSQCYKMFYEVLERLEML